MRASATIVAAFVLFAVAPAFADQRPGGEPPEGKGSAQSVERRLEGMARKRARARFGSRFRAAYVGPTRGGQSHQVRVRARRPGRWLLLETVEATLTFRPTVAGGDLAMLPESSIRSRFSDRSSGRLRQWWSNRNRTRAGLAAGAGRQGAGNGGKIGYYERVAGARANGEYGGGFWKGTFVDLDGGRARVTVEATTRRQRLLGRVVRAVVYLSPNSDAREAGASLNSLRGLQIHADFEPLSPGLVVRTAKHPVVRRVATNPAVLSALGVFLGAELLPALASVGIPLALAKAVAFAAAGIGTVHAVHTAAKPNFRVDAEQTFAELKRTDPTAANALLKTAGNEAAAIATLQRALESAHAAVPTQNTPSAVDLEGKDHRSQR